MEGAWRGASRIAPHIFARSHVFDVDIAVTYDHHICAGHQNNILKPFNIDEISASSIQPNSNFNQRNCNPFARLMALNPRFAGQRLAAGVTGKKTLHTLELCELQRLALLGGDYADACQILIMSARYDKSEPRKAQRTTQQID